MTWQWKFPARVDDIHDGDTFDVFLDCGRKNYGVEVVRLIWMHDDGTITGIQAPELIRGKKWYDHPHDHPGYLAANALAQWVRSTPDAPAIGTCLWYAHTIKRNWKTNEYTFGRYLCDLRRLETHESLGEYLLTGGYATEWKP